MPDYTYPEDRTGKRAGNKITKELQVVSYSADADFHVIVPTFSPFFADGVKVFKIVGGNRVPLQEGHDYHFGLRFMSASLSVAKGVYGAIVPINLQEDTRFEIEYQTLGGEWTLDTSGTLAMIANIVKNPRGLTWEQVTRLPKTFNPTDHPWNFEDMMGQRELIEAIERFTQQYATRSIASNDHHQIRGNPHETSKADIGLSEVHNFGVATLQEAMDGTPEKYITADTLQGTLEMMGLKDLGHLAIQFKEHLQDYNSPHQEDKHKIGLGQVANYRQATDEEIIRNIDTNNYLTLTGLKLWMKLYGGTLMEKQETHPPKDALLQTYCRDSDKSRMGIYADGKGGTYERVVKLKDVDCGYQESLPITHVPKGEVVQGYCSGSVYVEVVSLGNGQFMTRPNPTSHLCNKDQKHPPEGSIIGTTCDGTTLVRTLADGKGGTRVERVENSTQCVDQNKPVHPPAGNLLRYECRGFDMVGYYTDGKGGTYEAIIERNSRECGWKPIVIAPPPPQHPPAGSSLGTRCQGRDLMEIRANGAGGQYEVVKEYNSTQCGGGRPPPPPPRPPRPSPPPPPSQPQNKIGDLFFSSTHRDIYAGDHEVQTVNMRGWNPNTNYTIHLYIRTPALPGLEPDGSRKADANIHITTDSFGNGTGSLAQTAIDGIFPVATYECWATEANSKKQSNHITRIYKGPR